MNENLNEQLFANKIKRHLDDSLNLRAQHLARLQTAREAAIARQRKVSLLQAVPAAVGRSLEAIGIGPTVGRYLLPILVLGAGMLAYQQWRTIEPPPPDDPMSEIDAAILKDDLPIDAYLDRGFDAWLKREGKRDGE